MTARSSESFFVVIIFSFFFNYSIAQDIPYAREVINRLCDPGFHGRGYVQKGDKKAAEFIAQQYKALGVAPLGKSYFQDFKIPVNTLPGNLELQLNGQKLVAGKDYLIDPCSPAIKGNFEVMEVTKSVFSDMDKLRELLRSSGNKFLLINKVLFKDEPKEVHQQLNELIGFLKYNKDVSIKGLLITTDEKLTWHASQDVCNIPSFTILNSAVPEKINNVKVLVENKFIPEYNTQNVIGTIRGNQKPDSVIVFSAHYDHLGRMGKDTYFPGANDNASGVALMLDLARHFALVKNSPYTLVFIAFGAEEIGLLGSKYYVENPLFPLENIKLLLNLDIAGTGDDGITVVNGKIHKNFFDLLVAINAENQYLPEIKSRGEACNSDHCMFHLKGVPSFFIYTLGGIKAYHDVYDLPETLPLTRYEGYFKLISSFVNKLGH